MKSTFNINAVNYKVRSARLKKCLAVVVIGVALAFNAAGQDAPKYKSADYPGGIDQFYAYILSNMKLDRSCIPGRKVYVQFLIDKQGNLKRARVQGRELSPEMNAQLVKLFESAPKWQPAQQNGNAVKEHFVCPVMFMPKADMMAKADLPVMN